MVNKKYLLLAGLCSVLAAQPVFAQESESASASWSGRDMTYRGENYDVLDSSYYPKNRWPQYRKYINHQTPFPPKPNNMWEVGVNVGLFNVLGDVPSHSVFTAMKATDALGFGLTVRKALGYGLSARFQWVHGVASGFEYRRADPQNSPYKEIYGPQSANPMDVYYAYRTKVDEFSLQFIGAINNIRFHKAKNSFSLYAIVGSGAMIYTPKMNALNGDVPYDFTTLDAYNKDITYKDRKDVYDELKDFFDDTYESDPRKDSHKGKDDKNVVPVLDCGLGIQFRLGERVTLQLEDRVTFTFRDIVDGVYRQVNGSLTPDKDLLNYGSLGLNFNIGNKRKNVAPLWWVNPLDYAYWELSDPRHMKLPNPVLPDADGDGVTDQFDKCPGTPAGVAVDSHGCPLDTDGDGVPDYKDKQLITPTECQPVDADGVGKCPCPEGCGTAAPACGNIGAGSLTFSDNTSRISPAMQSQLANLAAQMMANPTCKVVIIGAGNASKVQQQRSWDRVNAIQEYMAEKHGIDRSRFIFQYGQPGDPNTVMYRAANPGEEGPSTVAPPFPNLRK